MENNQGYKNRALASLEGKWSKGIIATFIVLLIAGGVSEIITLPMGNNLGMSAGTTSVWSILCLPLDWGLTVYFLRLIRNEDLAYGHLFEGYKDFVRIFLTSLLVGICVSIGTLLLIVPGIILGLMFSQTSFILKDDKEISCTDAMKKSAEMMNGHKMRLFWLGLSFIGWAILSILTFGFGFLFLIPYVETTLAHFYEDLKAEVA